ncbi:hypothetical protein OKW21_004155 [Catalinimonas alkaloidigena]|uniref:3-keto-disaccharide hydrolase n=1 Tax=Catalinimonas alkaloidigena TaxID=1075417 RepID=UPI002406BAF4|nr:DUF1080 domain-containing protein [Catalinimonas alkaloidigena]MDF9798892.1 hypothetical protein [Catalinimonas alkaloidigena]
MMIKSIVIFTFLSAVLGCSSPRGNHTENSQEENATKEDKEQFSSSESEGWTMLFDGSGTDHWVELGTDQFPENGWEIENGALVLHEGGNIVTKEKYGDFNLSFEFNLTEGANSGIKYYVAEITNEKNGETAINGPEYQIIDDVNNPDIQDRKDETVTTAALYLLYSPENKKLLPPGQWNQGSIVSKNNQVEHWLNGVKVVSYERGSQDFLQKKMNTKFKNYTNYGEVPSGHIMLTDHHDKVYFRNIKIKRL